MDGLVVHDYGVCVAESLHTAVLYRAILPVLFGL